MTIRCLSWIKLLCCGVCSSLAALTVHVHAAETRQFVSIGTGGLTGVYYPAGGAICRLLNKGRKEHGIRCSVESTGGSIYNLNMMRGKEMEFGVVQSDWQYHAYQGSAVFAANGPDDKLRSVLSLHAEPFTVVARQEAGVSGFMDLAGKRVNIGNPGSGQRATLEVLLAAMGKTTDMFKLATELKASEMARALCDNKIDAFIYAVGHPNASIQEAGTACDIRLVDVTGAAVDKLIEEHSYYAKAVIPGGMYKGSPEDTQTFGVKATLVTHAEVPAVAVYELVKAVFENFEAFTQLHPAFAHLTPQQMLEGNSAPVHAGAVRYYREQGWNKTDGKPIP